MQIHRFLTLATLAVASGAALAHPGHSDPGIHLAEWLIALVVLVGAGLGVHSARKRITRHGRDRTGV